VDNLNVYIHASLIEECRKGSSKEQFRLYDQYSKAMYNLACRILTNRHINAFLVLPDKNIKTEQKALNDDKKEYMTYGTFGRNPGTAKVKIDATHGNIYIK
jgi:hypothetical protein